MSRFAEMSLPPGDRDDALPSQAPSSAPLFDAGRQSEEFPALPGVDLLLPRLERALTDGATAYADMMAARRRNDWPSYRSAAARLGTALQVDTKALSAQVAKAVSGATPSTNARSKAS